MTGLDAFAAEGVWLRCQLHCHTTRSDGTPEPDALVRHYADAGFDCVAITDHWLITDAPAGPDGLLLVPASELSADLERAPFEAEVLAIGLPRLPEPRAAFASIGACAAWIAAQGAAAILAHPRWSGLAPADVLGARDLHGLEVLNGGCQLEQGNGLSDALWDALAEAGHPLAAVATDDSHRAGDPAGSDSLLGWTWVRARERSAAAVVAALRAGACYASTGPEILAVERVGDGLEVACSPAAAVGLVAGPWDGGRVGADPAQAAYRACVLERDPDGLITRARLDAPEFSQWGRVEVEAPGGARAWTGPIGLPGDRSPFPTGG
ncbi:MAG: PHP domain-containing protein [Gemmatimonadota bacterium]